MGESRRVTLITEKNVQQKRCLSAFLILGADDMRGYSLGYIFTNGILTNMYILRYVFDSNV